MRDEWEIQELYDSGEYQKYHPEDLMNWILNGYTEHKFNVGDIAKYNGYEHTILAYDSTDDTYKIHWFTRDIWVSPEDLQKLGE
jgi:hypothetical protein